MLTVVLLEISQSKKKKKPNTVAITEKIREITFNDTWNQKELNGCNCHWGGLSVSDLLREGIRYHGLPQKLFLV